MIARATLLLLLLAAGCAPVPQPFRSETGAPLAVPLHSYGGVEIRPIDQSADPQGLAEALAKAFQNHGIVAYAAPGTGAILRVEGAEAAAGQIRLTWRLEARDGSESLSKIQVLPLPRWWAAAPGELASLIAADLADWVEPPVAEAALAPLPSLRFGGIKGAPGDGNVSLAAAVRSVLTERQVKLAADGEMTLIGEVKVSPHGDAAQLVEIAWILRDQAGAEIGVAQQGAPIPKGLMDGAWGTMALDVALGAADGILQILESARAE